ncbi:phosphatase PAP2 family protein [Nocardia sp. NPDC006630]|uniref:phosphatase PAP2 family protein n=1 Tax=Nocardia sp. NPDC006630 TaxID=3157181 RepID=UPI00339E8302
MVRVPWGRAGWLGLAAGVVGGVYLLLSWQVWVVGWAVDWDVGVWEWLVGHRTAGWTTVAREVTFFGNPGRASLIAILVAGVAWWRRRFGAAVLVYLGSRPGRMRAWGAAAVAAVLVVAMCATRLYLGVHWLTDVAGGVLLGTAVVLCAGVVQIRWQVDNEPTARSLNAQQGKEI